MYMVPNIKPAPSAAKMPVRACCDAPPRSAVAIASTVAPTTIAPAPPSTCAQSRVREPRSSLKSRQPHSRPTSEFVFQRGKAMERPTSRTAKMVSVLPTAQSIPPSFAQTIRCGFERRSASTNRVPLMTVGNDQRATNAPITMPMEMMNGAKPVLTSLVGASAVPNHMAAASPQNTPSLCRLIVDRECAAVALELKPSPQRHQQSNAHDQHRDRHPEVRVGADGEKRENAARPLHSSTSANRTGLRSSTDLRAASAIA